LNAVEILGDTPVKVRVLAEALYMPDPAFAKSPPAKMLPLLPFKVPVAPVAPIVIVSVEDSTPVSTFKLAVMPDLPTLTVPFTVSLKLERLSVPVERIKGPQDTSAVKVGLLAVRGMITESLEAGTLAGDQLFSLLQSVGPPPSPPTQV
jgi:hypothetical protein